METPGASLAHHARHLFDHTYSKNASTRAAASAVHHLDTVNGNRAPTRIIQRTNSGPAVEQLAGYGGGYGGGRCGDNVRRKDPQRWLGLTSRQETHPSSALNQFGYMARVVASNDGDGFRVERVSGPEATELKRGYINSVYGAVAPERERCDEKELDAADDSAGNDVATPVVQQQSTCTTPTCISAPNRTVATATTSAPLLERLRSRMHIDKYLAMMAFNSLLLNGDYIDELFFFDVPRPRPLRPLRPLRPPAQETHQPHPYFDFVALDFDEVAAPCHDRGRIAIRDPLL